ncbi:MAG: EamA family transporter [Candidatus Lokiarchaeota archaeon]|nr:EamA family transporter [Candidatus Lokiarchaeota archaeon]
MNSEKENDQENKSIGNILFLNPIIYGSTYVITQSITQIIPSFLYMTLRFLIGFIALFIIIIISFKKHSMKEANNNMKTQVKLAFMAGILFFITNASQTIGLKFTSPSNAGFITSLNIIFIPIILGVCYKQKQPLNVWFGVFLALIGIFILSFFDLESINVGDLLVLICAGCFSIYVIFINQNKEKIQLMRFNLYQMGFISVFSLLASFFTENWNEITESVIPALKSLNLILILIYIGFIATALTFLFQVLGQKHITPAKTAIILSLEPVFATLFGFLAGVETFSSIKILGFLCIFTGILIAKLQIKRNQGKIDESKPQINTKIQ